MDNIKLKERLTTIYSYLNKISVTGMDNAENLVISAKLLQELVVSITAEENEEEGDEEWRIWLQR